MGWSSRSDTEPSGGWFGPLGLARGTFERITDFFTSRAELTFLHVAPPPQLVFVCWRIDVGVRPRSERDTFARWAESANPQR